MTVANLRQTIADLDTCMTWVKTLIPDLRPSWRYFHYRELLDNVAQNTDDGISFHVRNNELPKVLEAFNSAEILKAIHRKFSNRVDRVFKVKLREATYGPLYRFQEGVGKGMQAWGHHGRNTEAELMIAALVKNPDSITFDSADFTIAARSFKIGVEVKRLQSPTQVVKLYLEAARQIQENPEIKWGVVMLRFDRLLYSNKRGPIYLSKPMLDIRRVAGMRFDGEQEITKFCRFQVEAFQVEFAYMFLEVTKKFDLKKVLGYGIHFTMPFSIEDPMRIKNDAIVKITFWGAKEGDAERIQAREEFMDTQEFKSRITIKSPSPIILV